MVVGEGLEGAVALVAGASGGIGRAIARAIAEAGASRILLLGRDTTRLAAAAAEVAAAGAEADPHVVDLEGPLPDIMPERLHLLVHAAGVHALSPVADTGDALAEAQFATNLLAPLRLTRAALPALKAAGGMVVFVNSSQGLAAGRGAAAYAASKHALRALADSLRAEMNADGVRVLSLFPGRTATAMQAALLEAEGRTPDPARLLRPEDVAAMLVAAAALPRNAEVTEITMRPSRPY